jgi:hypothetical protein
MILYLAPNAALCAGQAREQLMLFYFFGSDGSKPGSATVNGSVAFKLRPKSVRPPESSQPLPKFA